jgi:RimJ/RimL family protein N-acetyltransferase
MLYQNLSVKELQESDIAQIVSYWLDSDGAYLQAMGVDRSKLPAREELTQMLQGQLNLPLEKKRSYCLIWQLGDKAVGHCNTNPTQFGEEAFMHLHLWHAGNRKKGLGEAFLKRSVPVFFERLQLKKLISEPFALNPAPNKALEKIGFELVKEYVTVPGSLNFEQPVKRWELTRKQFKQMRSE